MTLKKTIAGYFLNNEWIPQRDINMHPLEEQSYKLHSDYEDLLKTLPKKLTSSEEHELIVESGIKAVQKKRQEYKNAHDALQPQLEQFMKNYIDSHSNWTKHCDLCCFNGIDPDSFDGDANILLKKD